METQEYVRRVIFWPHAFTGEISHLTKQRKPVNISIEAFVLGAINIILKDDSIIGTAEKTWEVTAFKESNEISYYSRVGTCQAVS